MSEFVTSGIEIQETAATIAAERRFIGGAVDAIKMARRDIERQIRKDRFFLTTLEPYDSGSCTSETTARMCAATKQAGVGPMAAVAGAIAQAALDAMIAEGCRHAWVDNGGDVALVLESPLTLEIFTTPGSSKAFAFELRTTGRAMGICSSSGRLGHSISFGDSDIAVTIADDAVVADAFATALGNEVKDETSLNKCFDILRSAKAVKGGLAMIDGAVAMYGEVPELVEVEHNPDRLTLHSAMCSSRFTGPAKVSQEMKA
jgi:ApbE superfamily uncharacterized protein (UPF0280 family)